MLQESLQKSRCLHSYQVPIWFDFLQEEGSASELRDHIATCKDCQLTLKAHQEKIIKINKLIPMARLAQNSKLELLKEIDEVARSVIPEIVTPIRYQTKSTAIFLVEAFRDLLRSFVSKQMITLYLLFGTILWFINR